MYKYFIVSIFAIVFILTTAKASTRDSIGVENYNGKKLIVHKVVAKDTYYSIGRRYNVVPKDVMNFNDSKYLQIGVIIKVPTNIPFTGNQAPAQSTGIPSQTTENVTEHTVQRKENLNMLAEKYGTTVNEIKRVNNLNTINLQIGQILKIPVTAAQQEQPVAQTVSPVENPIAAKETNDTAAKELNEEFLTHTVASNETMYSIATRYKLTMDQLKAKNNLTNNSLHVGQRLLIRGQYPTISDNTIATIDTDTLESLKDPSLRYAPSKYGLNQIDEKGTAVWISDSDLDPSKMLVLHRTAPIGTVMKITNPMSNRSTFAKVVGKFTENESTKNVIIVMTKAVADALGALDKRFFCNLTYGGQENEQ